MDRLTFEKYIEETYGYTADYPWMKYPDNAVYRHANNKKWFAIVMDVPRNKLGLESEETVSIVNLKCDFLLISSLIEKPGFFRAYHMNKTNWITAALDGTADDETIRWLLEMSYDATKKKK